PTPITLSLSMITPPPLSTLFPYTTLFRSLRAGRGSWHCALMPKRSSKQPEPEDTNQMAARIVATVTGAAQTAQETISRVAAELGDRKSTRLNSSHVSISYAVFCLKKKKKK